MHHDANFPAQKSPLFQQIRLSLHQQVFTIEQQDSNHQWGGSFVLVETQDQSFANGYFPGIAVDELYIAGRLSPKSLVVALRLRLAWQYGHRRAEIWQVVQGPVGVATSATDDPAEVQHYPVGTRLVLRQNALYTHGRSAPGPIVTYKRGGESKHNALPGRALDVALLLADGELSWSPTLLGKFARLIKAADARVHWGANFPGDFKDLPHFEV